MGETHRRYLPKSQELRMQFNLIFEQKKESFTKPNMEKPEPKREKVEQKK